MNKYLSEGPLTKITPVVKEISDVNLENWDYVFHILNWIKTNIQRDENVKHKYDNFKSVDEIIKNKKVSGCTDYSYLFATLMRVKGIPAKIIEGVWDQWLKSDDFENIQGHVIVSISLDGKEYFIDPDLKIVTLGPPKRLIIINEGIDPREMGYPDSATHTKKLIEFKKNWQKINGPGQ